MKNRRALVTRSVVAAAFLFTQAAVVGAYWVCDTCGCHIGHADCWFYDHDDVCNPNSQGECYLHLGTSCSGELEG